MKLQWRHILLLLAAAGSLTGVLSLSPIAQDPAYHAFADQRAFFDIPRFLDVVTNLPFLVVGIAGLLTTLRGGRSRACRSWAVFFAGVALVAAGSAVYHADPNDRTLLWDRLPMTIGFMAVLTAVLSEHVHEKIETYALLPAVLTGMASVLWWSWTGDLRLYCWVQLLPMIAIPLTLLLYPEERRSDRLVILALLLYALAKGAELFDQALYDGTSRTLSGHSLKHLAAAAGCAAILIMIRRSSLIHRSSTVNDQKNRAAIIADDPMSIPVREHER